MLANTMPADAHAEDGSAPTASAVAAMFVRAYYTALSTGPQNMGQFYADASQCTFVDDHLEEAENSARGKQVRLHHLVLTDARTNRLLQRPAVESLLDVAQCRIAPILE